MIFGVLQRYQNAEGKILVTPSVSKRKGKNWGEAAQHRGCLIAFHRAAPGLIFGIPKIFSIDVAEIH